jgi:intracellular multiplication protein IcmB
MSILYTVTRNLTKFFKAGMYDYGQIEGPDLVTGEKTCHRLVTKDGGLLTFFEVRGSYSYAGEKSFFSSLNNTLDALEGVLKNPGFHIEIVFIRDPENGYESIRRSIDAARATAKRLSLDVTALLDERRDTLSKRLSLERCYIVVKTDGSLLAPSQLNDAHQERISDLSGSGIGIKQGEFGQSPFVALKALRDAHEALLRTISISIGRTLDMKMIDAHESIKAITLAMGANVKHPKWRPSLLGDKIQPRELKESPIQGDISHLIPLDVSMQIFDRHPEISSDDATIVKYGDTYYAPLTVDVPAQKPDRINKLIESIDPNLPWMIKIKIDSGHDAAKSKTSSKKGWASFLAFSSSENEKIRDAAEELIARSTTETLCMASITACTWGGTVKQATKRKAVYMQALQGWGGIEVIEESGDPIHAWVNTLPGFSFTHIANRFPITLRDILTTAPFERPASPWTDGPILFSTLDGKAYPYWPGSSKQTASSSMYYAPPGFGKSFTLASMNMGFLLSPGLSELPFLTILDIGYSSRAYVELVRSMLPQDKKHQALAITYQMTPEFAFNPFDTPLGSRRPMSIDRSFLVNFLTLVLTPASANGDIQRLSELVGSLIDAIYDYFADENSPHFYEPGINAEVDQEIADRGFYPESDTTWWDITDYFASKKLFRLAQSAQRYAVPTLNDATAVLSSDSGIQELYKNSTHNGEPLLQFVNSMIITSIKNYPVLGQPTAFDMGDARIVSIDLSAVAAQGSAEADKQTAVMYMLARQMTCKEFYRDESLLRQVGSEYEEYHKARISLVKSLPKKICMDELHRTAKVPQVRTQAKIDIREGRKFSISVDLLSQMLDDFDQDMIKLVNNIYILSRGNSEDDIIQIKEKFNPSPDALKSARMVLNGPGPQGNSMLYFGTLKGEKSPLVEMIIRLALGPSEIWAYSTTPKDVRLRSMLSDKVGLSNALKGLGSMYPGGSAEAEIQSMLLAGESGGTDEVYDILIKKLISKINSM